MIEMRRILCPVDFSEYSRRALDHAMGIARWYGSTITVVHVSSMAQVATYAPGAADFAQVMMTPADRDHLLSEMSRLLESESAPGVAVESRLLEGNPAREILNEADRLPADLIVIGTHGRSGFERFLLGSVTEKVLRKARCPVLTVPRRSPDAVPASPPLFRRILCPVDFSDCSARALEYALSMAQEADAHLTVLHVDTPELDDTLIADGDVTLAEFQRRHEDQTCRRLKAAVPDDAASYCSVETMMSRGRPGQEILRIAAERRTELIVMGVQGRSAVDRLVFGSTTQHVVREAACPVLTLRQD